eukprot:5414170-Pleurochrysis_carterae.AAC.2
MQSSVSPQHAASAPMPFRVATCWSRKLFPRSKRSLAACLFASISLVQTARLQSANAPCPRSTRSQMQCPTHNTCETACDGPALSAPPLAPPGPPARFARTCRRRSRPRHGTQLECAWALRAKSDFGS